MLTMALPIALVRADSRGSLARQDRVFGDHLRVVDATVATHRKTAFIAPVSVVLTMAYFRRRELSSSRRLGWSCSSL